MFQITLRDARISSGYTVEEAARLCGVTVEAYNAYENDAGIIPKNTACKIKKMYHISLDLIYFSSNMVS